MNKGLASKIWLDFVLSRKFIYFLGLVALITTNLAQILLIRIMGYAVDLFNHNHKEIPVFFTGENDWDTFYRLLYFNIFCSIVLVIGRFGWRITFGRQTHHASSYLAGKIWDNVRFLPKEKLGHKYSKGLLMNAQTSDVAFSRFIFGFTLVGFFDAVFLGIMTTGTMMMISPLMTLCALGLSMFIPFVVHRLNGLEVARYQVAQESLSDFNDLSSQAIETIRLQRLTQTESLWGSMLKKSADGYRKIRLKAVSTSIQYIPVMGSASVVAFFTLFVLGIPLVFNGSMSIGDFVAMQGLIFVLQGPMAEMGMVVSEWKKGMTGLGRLAEIYNEKRDQFLFNKGENIERGHNVIEAKGLGLTFPDSTTPVFKGLDLKLENGERLGVIGPIGSGKTVLMSILSGLERRFEGDLQLFGKDYGEYSHAEIRRFIGMVQQRSFLFADTIRSNILMDLAASDEEIWHNLEIAGVADDVRALPHRLDTQLGEWGINLSGGQKQRLTLARALIRRPSLLLLDDCLSAVDTVTEEKILSNLDREIDKSSIVWVAHRRSTLRNCNRIIEMGTGCESGKQ